MPAENPYIRAARTPAGKLRLRPQFLIAKGKRKSKPKQKTGK
jgi:hypothetical protein